MGRIVKIKKKPEDKTAANAESNKNKTTNKKAEVKSEADQDRRNNTYAVTFDGATGQTAGLGDENEPNKDEPLIIRDPTTGKLLGYPNVVMVYRTTFAGEPLAKQSSGRGKVASHTKSTKSDTPSQYRYDQVVRSLYTQLRDDRKAAIVSRIRLHRYEAGMTNAGLYDYAVDTSGDFKEMVLIPVTSILWGTGTKNPADVSGAIASNPPDEGKKGKGKGKAPGNDPALAPASSSDKNGLMGESTPEAFQEKRNKELQEKIDGINRKLDGEKTRGKRDGSGLVAQQIAKKKELDAARADLLRTVTLNHKNKSQEFERLAPEELSDDEKKKQKTVSGLQAEYDALTEQVNLLKSERTELGIKKDDFRLAKNLNVSVRPVSDEFGFEVIGHNRFGRGVFVDRGQLRLKFQGREVNPLRIQFSATGGMLTDPPTNLKFGLQSDNTPEAFEKMQPEDWVTGASTNTKEEVTLTSVNTFSSAINHQIESNAQIGAIFIEADSTRRAKTIWELQPTVSTGLDEVGFPSCDCKLSRFQWYSLLPKEALQSILSVQGTEYVNSIMFIRTGFVYVDALTGEDTQNETTRSNRSASDAILNPKPDDILRFSEEERKNQLFAVYERKDSRGKVVETIRNPITNKEEAPVQIERRSEEPIADGDQPLISKTKPDFLAVLNQYLVARFSEAFEYNQEREERDVGLDLGVEIVKMGDEGYVDPNSILGASGGSLFDRASLGDPQALEALQNQASWEWSKSEEALEELKTTANESPLRSTGEAIATSATGIVSIIGKNVSPMPEVPVGGGSTVSQPQPFTPPPLKINTEKKPNASDSAQETNPFNSEASPFNSDSHTGDLTILPLSPEAPKK